MPCSLPRWTETGAFWLMAIARSPRRASSLSVQPSPFLRRVGVHIFTFEACSSFTRVTACKVAHPPFVGFIARLRPSQFPGSDARKLSSPTNNYLSGSFPHWRSAPLRRTEKCALGVHGRCARPTHIVGARRRIVVQNPLAALANLNLLAALEVLQILWTHRDVAN